METNNSQMVSLIWNIADDVLRDGAVSIPLPPLIEHELIVEYINLIIMPLNEALDNCLEQIKLFQERKQIIINDVETGKIKVI